MHNQLDETKKILQKLVSFPVMSGETNLAMIEYMVDYLKGYGIPSELVFSQDNTRANLFATIGPNEGDGIMLSGHTDVVHVKGQKWATDPFNLIEKDGRLYGRGSVDMKGFLACCLASAPNWIEQDLKRPIQFGFTYDEETGGYGADCLSEWLKDQPHKPNCAIIGEPTNMKIIAGHKGGSEITTKISGLEAHSSRPDTGVSAIHYAAKMINFILQKADEFRQNPHVESKFDPPYCSFNIGTINGGSSRNTIAGYCEFDWETRPIPGDDENQILDEIEQYCQNVLVPEMRKQYAEAKIETELKSSVPGLNIDETSTTMSIIKKLTGEQDYGVVSFGTDAGYFENIGIDSIVFGPGDISQAHKPDEYVEINELEKCLVFMDKLGEHLS